MHGDCMGDRAAYEQETRSVILSASRLTKMAPNGKQVLKDVSVAMYKGAKIGAPFPLTPAAHEPAYCDQASVTLRDFADTSFPICMQASWASTEAASRRS